MFKYINVNLKSNQLTDNVNPDKTIKLNPFPC